MEKEQILKLLNDGRVHQWNKYRTMHPDWTPDLRGLKLDSERFARGLDEAYLAEHFNLNGAVYDSTTEFQPHFEADVYGLIYKEKESDSVESKNIDGDARVNKLDIFITHSSKDNIFVEALTDLIRAALNISAEKIRCSSVPGYRLPTGADTDEQLRREVYDAKVLIGVMTKSSMKSAYVLFELGARWGAKKKMFPILACGADSGVLGGPLKGISSLSCNNAADVHQLIDEVGLELKLRKQSTASFQSKIEKLSKLSSQSEMPEEANEPKEEMVFDGSVYWLQKKENPEQRDGPFCQICYDKNGKRIRLQDHQDVAEPDWSCGVCNRFFDKK